jgi:AraC-like DNA-binding protein
MDLQRLRTRVGRDAIEPRRPTFHHLIALRRGTLRHTVDFAGYRLMVGEWLWIRPGQVQQWGNLTDVDGTLILFEPDFLDPGTIAGARLDDPYAPVRYVPTEEEQEALTDAADHLARTFSERGVLPVDVHQAVLRHELAVLVLRLANIVAATGGRTRGMSQAYARFRDAVERDFSRTRRLEDYAHSLGYSARTLSRATQAQAGINAKEYIDRRIILEAKRLLAHSDFTAAQVAARLGFTSATNFTKYFHQRTGVTPIAFRTGLA